MQRTAAAEAGKRGRETADGVFLGSRAAHTSRGGNVHIGHFKARARADAAEDSVIYVLCIDDIARVRRMQVVCGAEEILRAVFDVRHRLREQQRVQIDKDKLVRVPGRQRLGNVPLCLADDRDAAQGYRVACRRSVQRQGA